MDFEQAFITSSLLSPKSTFVTRVRDGSPGRTDGSAPVSIGVFPHGTDVIFLLAQIGPDRRERAAVGGPWRNPNA